MAKSNANEPPRLTLTQRWTGRPFFCVLFGLTFTAEGRKRNASQAELGGLFCCVCGAFPAIK